MSRPTTIRDEDLITAAREVFIERGYQATSAELAARAGVSEGTLFKRFGTKAGLFHACMAVSPEIVPWMRRLEEAQRAAEPLPVRDLLVDTARDVLAFYRVLVPSLMMRWSNPAVPESPEALVTAESAQAGAAFKSDWKTAGAEPPPLIALRRMSAWFAAEMARGRLRQTSPEVPARALLGTLFNFTFLEVIQAGRGAPSPEADPFIDELVDLLLHGLDPPESP